jgi:hypothetical protein
MVGHTAFAEQAFQDARLDAVHNIEFTEAGNVSSYEATFSIGTETVTGTAVVSPDGSSASFSLGDETAFGEAFQNLITFSTGDLALTIWNETDDSETSTWTLVDPGSTD